jgi:hypothetical protein
MEIEYPGDQTFFDLLVKSDQRILYTENSWVVLDYQVTNVEKVAENEFVVTARTFECDVEEFEDGEPFEIYGYEVTGKLVPVGNTREWELEFEGEYSELPGKSLESFDDREKLREIILGWI